MKKHSQETKTPRRHALVEKAPVLAAIIFAVIGWFIMLMTASFINVFIMAAVDSYPQQGLVGSLIGAALVLLLYKWCIIALSVEKKGVDAVRRVSLFRSVTVSVTKH